MRPLVVGLTGGIGSGKSTVAELMAELGAAVIDVDGLGREVLEPDGEAFTGVVDAFGPDVLAPDGSIDRAALAAMVFGPGQRLTELEAISHPAINQRLTGLLAEQGGDFVVLDIAVLAESRLGRTGEGTMYQRVVVVETPLQKRLERLATRGMTEADALQRIAAQASDDDRRLLADVVVSNDGSLADLRSRLALLGPTFEAWTAQVVTPALARATP